jgi:CheY-like chemotaxis protein
VPGNASQIRQILLNLIINASEAMGENAGSIIVQTRLIYVGADSLRGQAADLREGEYVRLEVIDSGSGMPPDVQERIFEPFYTTKTAGRGLGLATVQGIVRGHRGAIRLSSSPGVGTRFVILLPRVEAQVEAAPAAKRENARAVPTVLVVEDEEALRTAVCVLLRRNGYSVIEVAESAKAVDVFQARSAEIGAVLLDMTLPGMANGHLLEEMRRIRPDVKVILTSAYGPEAIRGSGGLGEAAFIRKPYHLTDLLHSLGEVLGVPGADAAASSHR